MDAFIEKNGIPTDVTQVGFTVKQGNQTKKLHGEYWSEFTIFGYKLKIKDCATGTRDWKSFAVFEINKVG